MLFKLQLAESKFFKKKFEFENFQKFFFLLRNVATVSIEQEIIYVGNEHGKLFTLRELFKKVFI